NDKRPARVTALHRGAYIVDDGSGERRATLSGKLRHRATAELLPAVGDWVLIGGSPNAGSAALVEWVATRSSSLIRAEPERPARGQVLATNVDVVLLGAALPLSVNLRRLERGVVLVWESGAVPVVVLTKADLCEDSEAVAANVRARLTGVPVLTLSALSGAGLDACRQHMHPAQTTVLLGPSGIGKSTLLNALLGAAHMRTAEIRSDGKGRHTTTHRQLFTLPNGALLIDTPGLRELQLWHDSEGLATTFDDITTLADACRFVDCKHRSEPGCAVLAAVEQGALERDRLAHWQKLQSEIAYMDGRDDPQAQRELKRLGAIGAKAARAHIRNKYR
ncbi:MAG: ribosome small subunit-dependent GTPase A, partial [Gemmatimonadota bacterium]